jgi:predicted transcriptional regulator of viral defense system
MRRDPTELRRALTRLAARQAGHFTAAQALAIGYSYPAQHYHTRRGEWLRIDRGIYRLSDWPVTPYEDLVRWVLWSHGQGTISHDTALTVHELGDAMPALVHLTVPPGFRATAPAVRLHTALVDRADMEQHEGFTVTSPLRSILDVAAAGMDIDQLARTIDDALERGQMTIGHLRTRADELGAHAALAVERALRELGR